MGTGPNGTERAYSGNSVFCYSFDSGAPMHVLCFISASNPSLPPPLPALLLTPAICCTKFIFGDAHHCELFTFSGCCYSLERAILNTARCHSNALAAQLLNTANVEACHWTHSWSSSLHLRAPRPSSLIFVLNLLSCLLVILTTFSMSVFIPLCARTRFCMIPKLWFVCNCWLIFVITGLLAYILQFI